MNTIKIVSLFCSLCSLGASFASPHTVEELSVYYKKEVVDDTVFVYREDITNGVKKEVWSIDGKPVDYERYEDELLEAEKEVRRIKRKMELEQRIRFQEAKLQSVGMLNKKLLKLSIKSIEGVLGRFEDHRLASFLVFDQNSVFSREEFEKLENELLNEAKSHLYRDEKDFDLEALKLMVASLDGIADRLQELFSVTVNNAIKQCDDTKLLKELLAVL